MQVKLLVIQDDGTKSTTGGSRMGRNPLATVGLELVTGDREVEELGVGNKLDMKG